MKTDTLVFWKHFCRNLLLLLEDNMDEECEYFSNSKSLSWGSCLAFAWFRMLLLIKVLLIKKSCISKWILEEGAYSKIDRNDKDCHAKRFYD